MSRSESESLEVVSPREDDFPASPPPLPQGPPPDAFAHGSPEELADDADQQDEPEDDDDSVDPRFAAALDQAAVQSGSVRISMVPVGTRAPVRLELGDLLRLQPAKRAGPPSLPLPTPPQDEDDDDDTVPIKPGPAPVRPSSPLPSPPGSPAPTPARVAVVAPASPRGMAGLGSSGKLLRSMGDSAGIPGLPAKSAPPSSVLAVTLANPELEVTLSHGRLLQDTAYFDVVFSFDTPEFKKDTVTAHMAVVRERLPLLLDERYSLKAVVKKNQTHVVVRKPSPAWALTPTVLRAVLCWAYTGVLPEPATISLPSLLDLFVFVENTGIADMLTECERRLDEFLRAHASMHDVVAAVFPRTQDDSRLRVCVCNFVFARWDAFLADKEGGRRMGIELMQQLTILKTRYDAGQRSAPPSARRSASVLSSFALIYREKNFSDCSLVCEGGYAVECHRWALWAASPLLARCFVERREKARSPRQSPRAVAHSAPSTSSAPWLCELRPLPSRSAAEAMCLFLYCGECSFSPADAVFLITHVTQTYDLPALQAACERALAPGLVATDSALTMSVLATTYLPAIAALPHVFQLRKTALKFVVDHFTVLDLGQLLLLPDHKVRADVLFGLQQKLLRWEERKQFEAFNVPADELAPK